MRISLVTDEISADFETAVELGVGWGVRAFELRGFGENRVPKLSEFQKQRINELVEAFEIDLIAISPGLFKCPFPRGPRERFPLRTFDIDMYQRWRNAHDLVKYHLEELLPLSIEYAKEIGVKTIVAFSFHRGAAAPGKAPDEVLAALRKAALLVDEAGLVLAIEVEDEFWADTGARTAAMVNAVDHPALRVNWDPGNAYVAGDAPYPNGYQVVKEHVHHVHFKDVDRTANGGYQYVVEGDIDWTGQIKELMQDGYNGYISVETHMEPKVHSARAATQRLEQLIEDAAE